MITSVLGPIISGVSTYFTSRQKIKEVELEGTIAVKKAEANAKIAVSEAKIRMAVEGRADTADLDKMAMQDMRTSYKDEYLLGLFSIPMILAFIPEYADVALKGFTVVDSMPEWYKWVFIGMVLVIFGLRGLATKFLDSKQSLFKREK
tara:strand:- start:947 stop:1390 length:444 start_codon:yes stop_codon:yes gene_type:complete